MSKKIDRALRGPSWIEVIFGALLSIVLGVVLGAVLMSVRPIAIVKELPKEADRDPKAIYYIEGTKDSTRGRQASAKRKAFVEGQSVTVTEDELNVLAAAAVPPAAAKPAAPAPKPPEKSKGADKAAPTPVVSDEILAAGTPNFRIRDSKLQIGVPVTFHALGVEQTVMVHTRGTFAKNGDVFVYEPETFFVGSCPLQRFPYVINYVRNKFMTSQQIPADIKTAWTKLANVSIEGNALKLTMP
jgi:hypothetical protein